jgi:hypothetical protein
MPWRTLKGLIYGGLNPRESMPMLLSVYRNGNVKLDELITRRYRLDQINDAPTCAKSVRARCNPVGSGCPPTGRRRVLSLARSRRSKDR